MNWVFLVDTVSLLAILAAWPALWRGGGRVLGRDAWWLLASLLALTLFHEVSNVLEWSGVTDGLDSYEDYSGLLFPVLWFLVVYALLRDRAAEALRENEERYRAVAEDMPALICRFLPGGEITYVNDTYCRHLGKTSEELIGLSFLSLIPETARETLMVNISSLTVGSPVRSHEHQVRMPDGTTRWQRWTNRALFDADGGPTAYQAIGEDTTERQRAREAIEDWRKRYEAAANASGQVVYDWDVGTNEVVYGGCLESVLGYAQDEMVGGLERWRDLVHPDDLSHFDAVTAQALKTKEAAHGSYRVRRKDGEYVWIEDTGELLSDTQGNPVRMVGFLKDVTKRRRAEETLREQRERAQSYLDLAGVMFVALDSEATVTLVNRRACDVLGYTEEEIVGRNWIDTFLPARLRETVREVATQVLRGEGESLAYYENAVLTKSGVERLIAWQNTVLRDEEGAIVGTLSSGEDITERKRAEEALRESEANLQSLFRAAPTGIGVVVDRVLKQVNERLCEMTGYSEGELIDQGARILYPSDEDYEYVGRVKYAQIRDLGTGTVETRWQRKDGRVIDVLLSSTPLDLADLSKGVTFTVLDITERELAKEALQASERNYREIFNSSGDAIVLHDVATGAVVDANKTMCDMFGYSHAEALCLTVQDISQGQPPYSQAEADRWIQRTIDEGHQSFEWLCRKRSGELFWTEVSLNLVTIGGQDRVMAVDRDISERKEAEAVRRDLEAQLRQAQKMEAVGQLAGGVAHDFNNILTAILGNVDVGLERVRTELGTNHGVVQSMEQIEKAARRAAALTRQLLTFSRRDVVQAATLNLNDILANMDEMLRRLISENITLETVADPALKAVRADASQIEQVIVNLAVNAAQAMPDGGRLTLETKNVTIDDDYTHAHAEARPGRHVLLAVSDTGHGMDAATLERVFEPFFTTKPVDQGTGLGLATVHGIVKQSGGHVMVYSELRRGTTFKVYLPAIEGAPADEPSVSQLDASWRGRETILLCEDDGPVRELTAGALRAAGYTVMTADSGQESIEAARNHTGVIDLLITDVIMPGMNGRALSEHLRATRPSLPTLFISGYTSNVIAHHGVLDEGVEFLEKPFSGAGLLAKVRAVLDKARSDA